MTTSEEYTLIDKTLAGETEAFSTIVKYYQNMVFTIVGKVIHNSENAQDVAQDVFIKAFNNLHSYRKASKFSTWLYSIAYNEAVTATKKNKNFFVQIPDNFDSQEEEDIDDIVYNPEMVAKLKQALIKLSPDENLLLTLFYKMDNSVENIATITNNSVSNVKVKLFRTRKKLLLLLQPDKNL